jgi:hypothetical protein
MAPQAGFDIEASERESANDAESAGWIRAESAERSEVLEAWKTA